MDWIKVKTNHILREYNDLRDSEFVAWIKIMALTADLEHEPTYQQMLREVHHKTLTSLQDKLKKHSTTLQDINKKVLRDVQEVLIKKDYWKQKKQRQRAFVQNVPGDVPPDVQGDVQEMSNDRLDKIRVDKNKEKKRKEKIAFSLPEWIDSKTWDAFIEMRKSLHAPLTDHSKNLIVKELEKLKAHGHAPNDVLNQSIVRSWRGVFPIRQEGSNGRGKGFSNDGPRVQPGEYVPERPPEVSAEGKARVDNLIAGLAARWQGADPPD